LSKIGQSLIGDKQNKNEHRRELNKRSGSKCELCGAAENLKVYELLPTKKGGLDEAMTCTTCKDQIENPETRI
jgi:protein PhnA